MSDQDDTTQKSQIQPSELMDETRLDCILSSIQSMLPLDEEGQPYHGFVLVIAANTEDDTCNYGSFSNLENKSVREVLQGCLESTAKEN